MSNALMELPLRPEDTLDLRVGADPSYAPLDDVTAGCFHTCCLTKQPEAASEGYAVAVIS